MFHGFRLIDDETLWRLVCDPANCGRTIPYYTQEVVRMINPPDFFRIFDNFSVDMLLFHENLAKCHVKEKFCEDLLGVQLFSAIRP